MLIPWTSSLIAAAAPAVDVADDGTWTGTIALTNTWSADNRQLLLDDETPVDVRPLPLPVTVQYVTGPRHDGATVGLMTLDDVWRDGPRIMGRGRIDMDDPQGAALARKIRGGFLRFVSADIDKVDGRMVCVDEQGEPVEDCVPGEDSSMQVGEFYTRWRIMGASLLAHPAFPEAQIQLADDQPDTADSDQEIVGYDPAWGCVRPDGAGGWKPADCAADDAVPAGPDGAPYDPEGAVVAAAALAVDTDLSWAPRGHAWDGAAAADRVEAWATPDGAEQFDPDRMARAFLVVGEPRTNKGSYRFGVADVIEGELRLVWDGVTAAYGALQGARTEPNLTEKQLDSALRQVHALYREAADEFDDPSILDLPGAGTDTSSEDEDMAVVAAAFRYDGWTPPTDWFRAPDLPDLQPVTIDEDGRLRGYLAAWGVKHRSFPGRAVTPPHSPSGYALFNTRPIHTSDGLVDVGLITMGTGHAALGLDRRSAVAHYDDTGTMAAVVRAGEDSRGIWLAGAVLPDLTNEQRLRLSLSRFSGDWRQEGTGLELVAALAVNTEGFPVPVKRSNDQGDYALVAAGALPALAAWAESVTSEDEAMGGHDLRARADAAAGRVQALRVQAATCRVGHLATWVEKAGGLPPYIKRIAKHLQEKGFDESRAIATAVNAAKRMCSNGDTNFPGVQHVNAGSRAEACAAVAQWEAKKAAS